MHGDKPSQGSFYKELKLLDNKLDCYLSHALHTEDPLFVITYERPKGDPVVIYVIHDGNLGFRQPSIIDLETLQKADQTKIPLNEQLDKQADLMDKVKQIQERRANESIEDAAKDNKYQLRNIYAKVVDGNMKGHKHVRRIEPKTKGYKVVDKRKINSDITTTSKPD